MTLEQAVKEFAQAKAAYEQAKCARDAACEALEEASQKRIGADQKIDAILREMIDAATKEVAA